jgi:hypothetical protein
MKKSKPSRGSGVPNNESYYKHPGLYLEDVLAACLWEARGKGWWSKSRSLLLVDAWGIFYYRQTQAGWERLYGLTHNRLRHLPDRLIFFPDGFRLDLFTGD